jgi:hypothetical protein
MGLLRPRVVTAQDVAADPKRDEDGYLAKVVKYIPGEIVAAYVAAAAALEQAGDSIPLETVLWIVSIVLFVLAPIWILIAAREPNMPAPVFQAVVAPIAFVAWVFALGGPFAFQAWYQPVYGTLVIIFVTIVIPLAEKLFIKPPG